jgi:hypothetical protein
MTRGLCVILLVWSMFLSPTLAQVVNGGSVSGPAPRIDVTAYGAKADTRVVQDGTIGAGNLSLLSSTNANFIQADVGKSITVSGAGPSSTDLVTTIQQFVTAGPP